MKRSAFSLIELMVVIAIVAVLSAIAVPAYKQYIQKAKFAGIMNVLAGLSGETKVYYPSHGSFPTLEQLGYPTIGDGTTSVNNGSINSFSDYIPVVSVASSNASTCNTGTILFYFAGTTGDTEIPDYMPNGIGTGANYGGSGYGGIVSADINGAINSYCFYQIYGDDNVYASGDYIPNCVNITDNTGYIASLDALFNSC